MDDQGLSLEALEKHLRQSSDRGNSVLYTIPTNHNPTGRTLSRRRRIQLLELCNRYDLPIIEDGAYEELTFDGTPPHPVSAPVLCLYDARRIRARGNSARAHHPKRNGQLALSRLSVFIFHCNFCTGGKKPHFAFSSVSSDSS